MKTSARKRERGVMNDNGRMEKLWKRAEKEKLENTKMIRLTRVRGKAQNSWNNSDFSSKH